jgi:hypothetical protein
LCSTMAVCPPWAVSCTLWQAMADAAGARGRGGAATSPATKTVAVAPKERQDSAGEPTSTLVASRSQLSPMWMHTANAAGELPRVEVSQPLAPPRWPGVGH